MAFQMPKANAPCRDCSDRTVGCHATCEKYAKYKKDMDKLRHELRKKMNEERATESYVADSVYRVQRKRIMMKEGR